MRKGLHGIALAAILLAVVWGAGAQGAVNQMVLQGKVADVQGLGLGGVRVLAFIAGFEKATTITAGDGGYALNFDYDDLADQTILVWYQPVLGDQVPELVLLRESSQAKRLGLWSPCVERLTAQPSMSHDVVLRSEKEEFEHLGQSGCLKVQ